MDDSEPVPDVTALIAAVNEALAGTASPFSGIGAFLASFYASCLTAGFPEQRAFGLTAALFSHYLSRLPQ